MPATAAARTPGAELTHNRARISTEVSSRAPYSRCTHANVAGRPAQRFTPVQPQSPPGQLRPATRQGASGGSKSGSPREICARPAKAISTSIARSRTRRPLECQRIVSAGTRRLGFTIKARDRRRRGRHADLPPRAAQYCCAGTRNGHAQIARAGVPARPIVRHMVEPAQAVARCWTVGAGRESARAGDRRRRRRPRRA
jgi:hypothetical protein